MNIIIIILWVILSTIAFVPYAPIIQKLAIWDKVLCIIIFIIGGPFFAVANILEEMLTTILGEGWDDDDHFKGC